MSENEERSIEWLAFRDNFDKDAQIRLCAQQLEVLRTAIGEKWQDLGKGGARGAGVAEAKALVKHVIRVASESVDFYATVDFITHRAHDHFESMRKAHPQNASLIGHLKSWDHVTHEHMVPGSEVLKALTEGGPASRPIAPILDSLSYRALVSGSKKKGARDTQSDAYKLDSLYKSKLPALSNTSLHAKGFHNLEQVPLELRALMRYDAAGLLTQLLPVSTRAVKLLRAYEHARPAEGAGPKMNPETTMPLLGWFTPLEAATSLDDVAANWHVLLELHHLAGGNEDPRYQDAIIAFLGRSSLPAHIKLAAVLAFVGSEDLDLRLALGCLDGELETAATDWPAMVAAIAAPLMPCIEVTSKDPWLQAFVQGRLLGLRDTIGYDGTSAGGWGNVFWNKFLAMSSRWADLGGVDLALSHGADIGYGDHAAIRAAAEGTHGNFRAAYYTQGRTHADYCRVFDALVGTTTIADVAGAALCAAAAVDNDDMLGYLAALGADIHMNDEAALAAAASGGGVTALEWLLERGADVHAANEAALLAAVAALDLATAEILLDAGADVHVDAELPLRTAFGCCPHDRYSVESDLAAPRAEMIELLTSHGADLRHPAAAEPG